MNDETILLVLAFGAGFTLGVLFMLALSRYTTVTEIVRDEHGRIIQIYEHCELTPPFGRRVLNVASVPQK